MKRIKPGGTPKPGTGDWPIRDWTISELLGMRRMPSGSRHSPRTREQDIESFMLHLRESRDSRMSCLLDERLLIELRECRDALAFWPPDCKRPAERRVINRLVWRIDPLVEYLQILADSDV